MKKCTFTVSYLMCFWEGEMQVNSIKNRVLSLVLVLITICLSVVCIIAFSDGNRSEYIVKSEDQVVVNRDQYEEAKKHQSTYLERARYERVSVRPYQYNDKNGIKKILELETLYKEDEKSTLYAVVLNDEKIYFNFDRVTKQVILFDLIEGNRAVRAQKDPKQLPIYQDHPGMHMVVSHLKTM